MMTVLALISGNAAWSQATKLIKVVVPLPPGGGADILERWSRLSEQFLRIDKWSVCRG
jgi:hypothetical protein